MRLAGRKQQAQQGKWKDEFHSAEGWLKKAALKLGIIPGFCNTPFAKMVLRNNEREFVYFRTSMKTRKKYHYQNLSLKDIKGERWEDIPGLDGYFCVSNYGRIKRLEFEMMYKDGRICLRKERIIKPMIVTEKLQKKKLENKFLAVRVCLETYRYNFTIARLVYHCFIQAFNLDDHKKVVICKDTDNFNIRLNNLKLFTLSEKVQRSIERDRYPDNLAGISAEKRLAIQKRIVAVRSKQVSQYDQEGRRLNTFASIRKASQKIGVHEVGISAVIRGKKNTAGGYYWKLGKEPELNVSAIKKLRREEYLKKYGQKVTQFDLNGKMLAHYPSILSASQATGVQNSAIYQVLLGKYKSTRGFFWKKGYIHHDIDLSDYVWGRASMAITQQKAVRQLTLDGKMIMEFPSMKLAAEKLKLKGSCISSAVSGRQKTCGGYCWELVR